MLKINPLAILVTICIALLVGIIWAIVDIEKSRVKIGMGHSKGYTLLMDVKWWCGLIIEMIGAFIWGIIGAAINLLIIIFTLLFELPKFLRPEPQAYDESIPGDKGFNK